MKDHLLTVKFRVVGIKRLEICFWISKQLFRLAGWVAGFGTTKIEEDPPYIPLDIRRLYKKYHAQSSKKKQP